jgi:pimeloyl-ACP methyl ester carboxylesterase
MGRTHTCIWIAAATIACAAPRAERYTARAPDGVEIAYEVAGAGEPTLVLVHGWACDRTFWSEQIGALSRDHRVVALDLAGHGESGSDRARWDVATLAGDVQAVADALALERAILIGHSMGGPVCLEAAARLRGRALGVIGLDTLHDAEFEIPREALAGIAKAFETDYAATMSQAIDSMFGPYGSRDLRDWIVERALASPKEPALALFASFPDFDPKRALAAAAVPVRCINAAPSAQRAIPTSVEHNSKYADYDAVAIEGVGHWLMLERPDLVNPRLREAIRELDQRAAP